MLNFIELFFDEKNIKTQNLSDNIHIVYQETLRFEQKFHLKFS